MKRKGGRKKGGKTGGKGWREKDHKVGGGKRTHLCPMGGKIERGERLSEEGMSGGVSTQNDKITEGGVLKE